MTGCYSGEGYKLLLIGKNISVRLQGRLWMVREAVEKARELKPDIVIMDINLPKLNGLEEQFALFRIRLRGIIRFYDRVYRI